MGNKKRSTTRYRIDIIYGTEPDLLRKRTKEKKIKKPKLIMKETEPALQSIMVNLLGCLHRNAP